MAHTTPTAQQALQVYDAQGELQMLEFLQRNGTPPDIGADQPQEQQKVQTDRYNLPDGTHITHQPGHYHFHWSVINRRIRPQDARRPASIGPGQFPVYEPEPTPLLHWPNSDTIWHRIMSEIEERAADQLKLERQYDNPPATARNQSYFAAPSLYQAIHQAIREYDMPEFLLQILELEAAERAETVCDNLDPKELEQLLQAATQALQQQQPPLEPAPENPAHEERIPQMKDPTTGQTDQPDATQDDSKPIGWLFARSRKVILYRCNRHLEDKLSKPWPGVVAHPAFVDSHQCEMCSTPQNSQPAPR